MSPVLLKMLQPRTVIVAWAMLWMVVVPFVHIHPETDHRHGDIGHAHGGTAHTVFSSDLPCEYAAHHASPATIAAITQAAHDLGHPEIGFSLAVSGDRYLGKAAVSETLAAAMPPPLPQPSDSACFDPFLDSPQSVLLSANCSSRAPPRLFV